MSALDAEFLHLEDGVNHMHIGACAVFEGPAPSESEVEGLMGAAVAAIPRYRQRVRTVPLELGRPVWVDDPDFDLTHHVWRTALPEPGTDGALQALVAEVMGSELNRDHPLWEMWFVDGLAGGRWAIIGKVHHTLVDGVAGAGLLEVMFSDQPEPAPQPDSPAWRVEPAPSETRLAADAVGQLAQSALAVGRGVATSLTHPGDTVRALRTIGSGLSSWLGEVLVPTPPVSVDGPVGPQRRWTWVEVPLETAKAIRAERGGTVNDVILAAVTRGFRDLLRHRGEDPQKTEMRTLVPVSVRSEAGRLDNEVSALVAELPVGIEIPELRYEAVRQETRWLKLSHESEAGEALSTLADVVPPPLLAYGTRAVLGLLRRQRNINTVVTNVPGPQFPLFAAGRRLLAYHPYVPVALGVRVTVAIFSYDGRLSFGLTGDETVSDLDELARGIEAGIAELQVDPG